MEPAVVPYGGLHDLWSAAGGEEDEHQHRRRHAGDRQGEQRQQHPLTRFLSGRPLNNKEWRQGSAPKKQGDDRTVVNGWPSRSRVLPSRR